jgi:spermidine synthase
MHMTALELPATASTSAAPRYRALYVLFFFSGLPALIYQLTWQRSLFRIFGVNAESVTIIVTAFMLGLGLGSLAGGRLTRFRHVKPLLVLGIIELSTAAFGLVSLSIFERVGQFVLNWPLFAVAIINLLLVLLPTILMGATLPILVAHLVRRSGQIASAVGLLYYVNTLGASAACLLCAVVIFPYSGMHAAVCIAAGINVVVAIGALLAHWLGQDSLDAERRAERAPATRPILGMPYVSLLAAVGGFISLSYEIFLFRSASFASGSSSSAFALVLCAFLAGIAGGAYNAAQICNRLSPPDAMRQAVTGLIEANIVGAAFLPLMAHFAWAGTGFVWMILLATYLIARQWGALLPFLSHFGIRPDDRAGMHTALLYSANIAGCAAGAVLTGFVLTNQLSLQQIAIVLLAAGTLCSLLLIARFPVGPGVRLRTAAIAVSVLVVGGIAVPRLSHHLFENLQNKALPNEDFADVVENRSGIITVDRDGTVFGNGMYDGRFNTDLKTDRNGIMRPYALSLFHPSPRDVLMIGLSSGSWAQVVANNPDVASLTIVEINPGYLQLIARQAATKSVLDNPKVVIIEDDGRRWLNRHPERRFDAIVSNTTWNFRANAANLLSTEFLALAKMHLNRGGIIFYNTTDSARVQRTACTVFPHGARFMNHMVASEAPIDWDVPRWRSVLENYAIDGKRQFDPNNPADRERLDALLTEYGPGGSQIEECPAVLSRTSGKALITDDNMGTEWRHYLGLE